MAPDMRWFPHRSAWGLYRIWKSTYFSVCCVRSGKLLEIICSPAGIGTLLVTSWPMVLTGEVAEATLLTWGECYYTGLGAELKGSLASSQSKGYAAAIMSRIHLSINGKPTASFLATICSGQVMFPVTRRQGKALSTSPALCWAVLK